MSFHPPDRGFYRRLLIRAVAIAGGIALIEPMINKVAFFHEHLWKKVISRRGRGKAKPWYRAQAALV